MPDRDSDGGRSVRMELSRARGLLGIAFLMMVAVPVQASDGALEINQTCAVETGCFAGDTPGYPVTIGEAGSYRLTSNLSITADVTGIEISSSYVTLDLGGFQIAGPVSCSGTGIDLTCSARGTSDGVLALSSARYVTIRNGTVRNMSRDGVGIEADGTVEGIVARHNSRHGIASSQSVHARHSQAIENGDDGFDLDQGSIVDGCTATGNWQHGVEIDAEGGVVYGTVSRGNGARGLNIVAGSRFGKNNVSTGHAFPDSCGGRFCSERKRVYMAGSFLPGVSATSSACDPGFRMAGPNELVEGRLANYDGSRSNLVQLGVNRFESTWGGGVSPGGIFECEDVDDILGGNTSGIRCSQGNVLNLTSGWKFKRPPYAQQAVSTLCVEE